MRKFSILIPTYNRPEYLRRILNYYNEDGENHNIIIADSSSSENKQANKEIISTFSNPNISHFNNYSSKLNVFHKIADVVNYAHGKYCVLCADDDFITPNGIKQSVDFLEKSPGFTVTHGHYISFCLRTDETGNRQFWWTPTYYPPKSIMFPDAQSRLRVHLSNYDIPTLYGVHRTDFMHMIFRETVKYTNDPRFGELLPSMLTLIYGKMKCLNMFYGAREIIPGSLLATCENLRDFIEAGTYNDKYVKFRDCLVGHLSKQSPLGIEKSKGVIDDGMAAYMNKYHLNNYSYSTNYKRLLMHKMKDILDYLKLPSWIDREIRVSYRRLFVPPNRMQMDDSRSSVDILFPACYGDFSKIRSHVLSYSRRLRKNGNIFSVG